MSEKRSLEWGETAWDNLSREDLLKEVWKMASALQSASTVISQSRNANFWHRVVVNGDEYSPDEITKQLDELASQDLYWGKGTGGAAYEKVNQALSILEDYSGEDVYRAFFRYADDLLFERKTSKIGFGWVICDTCGTAVGESSSGKSDLGNPCSFGKNGCKGKMRELEWSDLRKDFDGDGKTEKS